MPIWKNKLEGGRARWVCASFAKIFDGRPGCLRSIIGTTGNCVGCKSFPCVIQSFSSRLQRCIWPGLKRTRSSAFICRPSLYVGWMHGLTPKSTDFAKQIQIGSPQARQPPIIYLENTSISAGTNSTSSWASQTGDASDVRLCSAQYFELCHENLTRRSSD